jgi:hypothetical protein
MISKRPLAALLWVAIVMIAVQMSPVAALAHAGHTHAHDSISSVAHHQPNGNATQVNTAPANAEHAGAVAEAAALGPDADRAAASTKCRLGCCANGGFSCCAPAMLCENAPDLPGCMSGLKVVRLRTRTESGVDPETLPKPPKSFT